MSSDSTNSKSQPDSAPRAQKRPASPSGHNRGRVNFSALLRQASAKSADKKQLEADILRLQEECRAANEEKARLENYHWAREAITEEEKRLREIIKERDATMHSKSTKVSKLEAQVKTQRGYKVSYRENHFKANSQLKKMTTALNEEKAARQ